MEGGTLYNQAPLAGVPMESSNVTEFYRTCRISIAYAIPRDQSPIIGPWDNGRYPLHA